ncbi:hypothetical protein [Falsiroseomonas oryzae]|uniref:hypothetical protein n=1 Tax=Falsiroseomonas oryzae TaxID=2766473 RepID=UPI0022EB3B00|nr:hypothetical protein [Roseomonas sp. MO-31]
MSRTERWIAALFPIGFGLVGILLGKDDNWDLLHYHYYNPHAWLHGRHGHDLLAADFHVFFNPLLDLPFYWGNQVLPGVVVAFLLGAVHGLVGLLAWRIGVRVLGREAGVPALVPALIGMLGGGSLYVVGTTYYDVTVALPVFAGLWLIARNATLVFEGPLARSLPLLLLAGTIAGAGPGLKQTVAPFAASVPVALLLLARGRRLATSFAFGAGLGLGVLALSGFWLWHLWQTTGNPLFPYFNDIFRSPLAPIGNNRAMGAMPRGLLDTLAFPVFFTLTPWRIDGATRDPKLILAYVMVPVGLAFALTSRRRPALADPRLGLFLLVVAAVTYVVWLRLFSIYRYIIPVEILAPLLVVVAVGFLPLAERARRIAVVALLILAMPVQLSFRDRIAWGGSHWRPFVSAVPPVGMDLTGGLVVVPGWHPGWRANAFTIPFFPPDLPFLRIIAHDDPAGRLVTGFDDEIARRIATHAGPLFVLWTPTERGRPHVTASLARHGLVTDFAGCGRLQTSIGGPLEVCPVRRGG